MSRVFARWAGLCAVLLSFAVVAAPAAAWEQPAEMPYREVLTPPGGKAPVGAMLVIHGGGWVGGKDMAIAARPDAERYAEQGWLVWNVDYRSYENAFGDVRMWFRMLEAETELPICASGGSAGGHLALVLAAYEHVDCVVSEGGPTDLDRLHPWLDQHLDPTFGDERWEWSPQRFAEEDPAVFAETDILLGHAVDDQLVPVDAVRDFAATIPDRTELHAMKTGRAPFVHARVDRAALDAYREAERRLLTRVANPGSAAVSSSALTVATAPGTASDLRIQRTADGLTVTDPAGLRPGAGCRAVDPASVECDPAGVKNAVIYAGDRADRVRPDAGIPVTVAAGEGDDRVEDGAGANTLAGGPGNDTLLSASGADRLLGGDGRDIADYGSRAEPLNITIDGKANDGASSEGDNVGLDVEWLVGGSGKDKLTGSSDAEGFWGQAGADTVDGGTGADWLNGGAGTDTIDYSGRTAALSLSLDDAANDGENGEGDGIGTDFEYVVGGAGNDRLTGSADAEGFWGQGGDDAIDGGAGTDWLNGGGGADAIDYSSRTAPLSLSLDGKPNDGEAGEGDAIGSDFETLIGGAGADSLRGSSSRDRLEGRQGDDTLEGLGARDSFDGGAGSDTTRSRDLEFDDIACGDGEDRVVGDLLDVLLGDCELLDLL